MVVPATDSKIDHDMQVTEGTDTDGLATKWTTGYDTFQWSAVYEIKKN